MVCAEKSLKKEIGIFRTTVILNDLFYLLDLIYFLELSSNDLAILRIIEPKFSLKYTNQLLLRLFSFGAHTSSKFNSLDLAG